jgi:hypothetical protein
MDPQQFDALSRTFAHASSRRRAITRFGAAGLLAGLADARGRDRAAARPATQGAPCRLALVATVRLGPDATERMQTEVPGELRGELSFSLGPEGLLEAGRLLLDGGTEAPVVGQATGHGLQLRADLSVVQEGLALVLVGTAEEPLSRCRGAVDGLLTGPLPGDLGDWHATATAGETVTIPPTPVPAAQTCAPGLTRCGGACVDLNSDLANCGGCGTVCTAERSCINGFCLGSCQPGFTLCPSGCVDLNSDSINCGRCGAICGGGDAPYVCQGGQCVLVDCGGGMEYCGSVALCRDLSSDPEHCGTCFNGCPSGFCSGGVCQSVPIANIPLDEAPPDQLAPCPPGLVLCNSGCADLNVDIINCGRCGAVCGGGDALYVCQGGVCVGPDSACPPGQIICGDGMGVCVDPMVDPFNCGSCAHLCGPGLTCINGSCL